MSTRRSAVAVSLIGVVLATLLHTQPSNAEGDATSSVEPAGPAAPETLQESDIAHAQDIRERIGLRADAEWVTEIERASSGDSGRRANMFGIAVSEEEDEALQDYVALSAASTRAQARIDEITGERGSAGSMIRVEADGPRFVYFYAGDPLVSPADVRESFTDEQFESVEFERVKYSLEELESTVEAIAGHLDDARVPNGGVQIDVERNLVEVLLPPEDLTTREFLSATYPSDRVTVTTSEAATLGETSGIHRNQLAYLGLAYGGQALGQTANQSLSGVCTSGFAVYGYGEFILTANHCSLTPTYGEDWYQGGLKLGDTVAYSVRANGADAQAISTGGQRLIKSHLLKDHINNYENVTFIAGNTGVNGAMCQYGMTTTGMDGTQNPAGRCGQITSICYNPPGPLYGGCYRRANFMAMPGDSGGPISAYTVYGWAAEGLMVGCIAPADPPGAPCFTNPWQTVYSSMDTVKNLWNLSLPPL